MNERNELFEGLQLRIAAVEYLICRLISLQDNKAIENIYTSTINEINVLKEECPDNARVLEMVLHLTGRQ